MRIVMFYHSLISDWNHGNAHFLRGITTELMARGHDVTVYEQRNAWSVRNLIASYGEPALDGFRSVYPGLKSVRYELETIDLDNELRGADLVIVHEWNHPELVRRVGQYREEIGDFVLFFHDTHHRAVTAPEELARLDLHAYDGVLAFGNAVAEKYRQQGWADRTWTWHEAADTRVFTGNGRPDAAGADFEGDLVWIGNWGDGERSDEIREFLLRPVKDLGLRARIYGVRYPESALEELAAANIEYGGWLPNYEAPRVFSRFRMTVHVPRRPYAMALPGIPTIRVFEALSCKIPLVSAFWADVEHLFTPGEDYRVARDGAEMTRHLVALMDDPLRARELAHHGHQTILSRHTCAHRVGELLAIYAQVAEGTREAVA